MSEKTYDYAVVEDGEVQARLWGYDEAVSWLEAHYPNAIPLAADVWQTELMGRIEIVY